MSESGRKPSENRLEPTIVPVRRPVAEPADARSGSGHGRGRMLLLGALVVLVGAGLFTVFVYLPQWMAQAPPPEVVEEAPEEATIEMPVLSAEELAALQEQAETLLAQLLEQQQALGLRSAASWGDTTWSAYEAAADDGDDAFLAEDFSQSVELYETALDLGAALLARSQDIVADALAAGEAALESGNSELAASQFDLVLTIDPANRQAQRGLARAESLPAVIEAMRRGEQSTESGALEQARAAYREALAIDPDFTAARRALDAVNARIAATRFDTLIAEAYAAIDANRFELAIESFTAALALRPTSAAALDGLAKAEQGLELYAIDLAKIRAEAFEGRERWDSAIERYREALATDPTLAFALEGLERSQARADLDAKLQAMLERPRRLLIEAGLADAELVLGEARLIAEPGPRLSAQIAELSELVTVASTPIKVTLVSDNETEVTIYRVGDLGSFASMEIKLKPGDYTAVGQRRRYRDVRVSFTVLPGADNGPVTVICTEQI